MHQQERVITEKDTFFCCLYLLSKAIQPQWNAPARTCRKESNRRTQITEEKDTKSKGFPGNLHNHERPEFIHLT